MSRVPHFMYTCADHNYVMYEFSAGWWTYTVLECSNERCFWVGLENRRFRWNIFS